MLLRELTQPTVSTVDEAKKRKRKARRTLGMPAAYGPGPYGGYGYYAGYSGDSSGGGDGGGGGESVNRGVAEVRSNPDQNTKPESGMKELQAVAKTITDPEKWAISMTAEPKLGINPQAGISEDTPKGIYFYPLNYALDLVQRRKTLPWGDNMPYIQLFQYDRAGEMTKETSVDSAQLKQALLQYCPEEVIQQAIDEPEYDGTPYWFIYDCLSRLGKSDETNIVRWNKVLRDLGFTSVFDDGHGWIAYNEPTQGVVLDPRIIKQHKTISNKKQSRVVTPAVIERAIFDTLDIELAANRAWQAYDPDGSKLRVAAKEYAKKPEFKQWFGKPGSEEIFDKAASWGRYGARQLSQTAWEWYKAQQAQTATENFADGRNPQDKGDSKRHGINTKASVSSLRKTAKQGGRKGQLAHWLANMKAGRQRANESAEDKFSFQIFKDFFPIAMKVLDIDKLPKINLVMQVDETDQPTYGRFDHGNLINDLGMANRHPIDILRTLAHELVHFKQYLNDQLGTESGETGSPEENEAHELAGVIMRHFNKQHRHYFKSKPLTL